MKVNIILVDECGDEVVAEVIDAKRVEALGERLSTFVDMVISEVRASYPEARGVYREDVKSQAEEMCDQYQAVYEGYLSWALEHEDELDGYDPYEWADEQTRGEFEYGAYCGW